MGEMKKHIPVQHIVGFLLSIGLTLAAVWAALGSNLPVRWIIISILVLAVIQAGIQLFMFMHMTESTSGGGHIPWNMMFHGFVLAAIIVVGSIFTMSFGFNHDHGGGGHHEEQHSDH